jgi:hypothetical protein
MELPSKALSPIIILVVVIYSTGAHHQGDHHPQPLASSTRSQSFQSWLAITAGAATVAVISTAIAAIARTKRMRSDKTLYLLSLCTRREASGVFCPSSVDNWDSGPLFWSPPPRCILKN